MTCDGLTSHPGGVEILLFMLQNPGISSGSYDPVGSRASFFFYTFTTSTNIFQVKKKPNWGL